MNPGISKQARGFSLVIVLILLIVMSVLGVAVLRSSAMQERMSGNLRDRSLAFQAAEAALRFAQERLAVNPPVDADNPDDQGWDTLVSEESPPTEEQCSRLGVCANGHAPSWQPGPTLGATDPNVPDTPTQYWVEYLGNGPAEMGRCLEGVRGGGPSSDCLKPMFRITARSRASGRAEVVLQANVIHKLPEL